MRKNQLSIRLNGKPVGILEQTHSNKMLFTYSNDATAVISMSMPLRKEPYGDIYCQAYFAGLLPENEISKKLIGKKYGISPNNSFALLGAIGRDCAGAISCHSIDDPIFSETSVPLQGNIISDDELYQHIKNLPSYPLFMDVAELRLSLAGVQDKAAICLINNQIALPKYGCPTTHILKSNAGHFEGLLENENFCLKIAKRIGLPVAEVELKQINDIRFLLIKRYDRAIKKHEIKRIHQEDFCQALGILSTKKYQNEGGPSFKNCFDLLKNTTIPAVDRNTLASVLIFNYLIGNMDAHGKNFSLLHNSSTNIRLAPFYDIICTQAYDNLTNKMSMKIGSKYNFQEVLPRHWQQLCEEVDYRYSALLNLIEEFGDKIRTAASIEQEALNSNGFYHPIITKIVSKINQNIELTFKRMHSTNK